VRAWGDRITVQESTGECWNPIAINHERKPFDDRRVRRALTLALDRYQGASALSRLTILREVSGTEGVGSPFATPPAELERLAGYSRATAAPPPEARRPLPEASAPGGSACLLLNRAHPTP